MTRILGDLKGYILSKRIKFAKSSNKEKLYQEIVNHLITTINNIKNFDTIESIIPSLVEALCKDFRLGKNITDSLKYSNPNTIQSIVRLTLDYTPSEYTEFPKLVLKKPLLPEETQKSIMLKHGEILQEPFSSNAENKIQEQPVIDVQVNNGDDKETFEKEATNTDHLSEQNDDLIGVDKEEMILSADQVYLKLQRGSDFGGSIRGLLRKGRNRGAKKYETIDNIIKKIGPFILNLHDNRGKNEDIPSEMNQKSVAEIHAFISGKDEFSLSKDDWAHVLITEKKTNPEGIYLLLSAYLIGDMEECKKLTGRFKEAKKKTKAKSVIRKAKAKPVIAKEKTKPVIVKAKAKPVIKKTKVKPVIKKTKVKEKENLEPEDKLIDLYKGAGYSFAYNLTKNEADAEDLINEAYYRAYTNLDKYRKGTNIKARFFTITKNIFINGYRKKKKNGIDYSDDSQRLEHKGGSVQAKAYGNLSEKYILSLVDELDDSVAIPFLLHHEGYKYQEIADRLDLPLGTVKSRIFFARKGIKEKLDLVYTQKF